MPTKKKQMLKHKKGTLQENEALFRAFMDNSPTIAWMKDIKGRFVYVSDSFRTIFRLEKNYAGLTADDLLPTEMADQHAENDRVVLGLNRPIQVIENAVNPDGNPTLWLVTKFPFTTANGERFVGGVGVDITVRNSMEAAIKESEARFRLFMDNSHATAWIKDDEGRYLYFNKTHERCFNVRLEDWLGKTDAELLPEKTARQFREHDLDVLISGRPMEFEEESVHPDGSVKTWLVSKFPYSANRKQLIAGVGIDITERKKAETESRLLSAIVKSSYDAIIGKTLDGTITSWNPGAERLYGYSASEVIGKSINILLPPEYPDDISDILRRVANQEYTYDYETVRRRKDGILVNVSLRVSPILNKSGEVVGATTIARDITRREQAEESPSSE